MKLPATLAALFLSGAALSASTLASPDGRLAVKLALDDGRLFYSLTLDGAPMLEDSPLGLETSLGSFAEGLSAEGAPATHRIDEEYDLPHGKVAHVHYVANELTESFRNTDGNLMEVTFRLSNRDAAFRYRISGPDKWRVVVTKENSGFRFPAEATAFATWQAKAGGGFAGTKPSYEEGYELDAAIGTPSPTRLGFTFPALFRVGDAGWVLLSETGTTGRYAGTRLSDPTPEGLYTIAFPEKDENGGIGESAVFGALPLETPWRTITVGKTLAGIVESTAATDLVKPLYEPSRDYKAGRATWSWILWQDASMNWNDQVAFIDLAAKMGYEYILIDAFWDANIGREKMADLVAYAASKKVGVFLWYNSNGAWSDAFQTPRDKLSHAADREREMAWLEKIGVKGIKVDFFGGDKQVTIALYEDILTCANSHGLMCNFHGATIPRGWERMFPNYMTSEAVTASENLVFSQNFVDGEAERSTILPFVRNAIGPMDYGPVFFSKRFSRSADHGNVRRTGIGFQLATAVLFQSPLQHFGLTPDDLTPENADALAFLKGVPAAWDETRYVDGYPGQYAVLARRSGSAWYVAATNGTREPKTPTFALPFLAGKTVTLLCDTVELTAAKKTLTVPADGSVTLALPVGGGAVLFTE
jgi:hypothetical protein